MSKAAPYTYPDLNNFFLAALSPATGEVILPSYYRPWHFNSNPVQLGGDTTTPTAAPLPRRLEPWNPNDPVLKWNTDWVIPEGRAKIPVLASLADKNDAEFFGVLTKEEHEALDRILRVLAERRELNATPVD